MNPESNPPSGSVAAHTFLCSLCDKAAATVQVSQGEVVMEGFLGRLSAKTSQNQDEALRAAVKAGDPHALYKVDTEVAAFFCPHCNACYCKQHWRTQDVFEEEGWNDCVRGTCPQGHERTLWD